MAIFDNGKTVNIIEIQNNTAGASAAQTIEINLELFYEHSFAYSLAKNEKGVGEDESIKHGLFSEHTFMRHIVKWKDNKAVPTESEEKEKGKAGN